MDNVFAVYKPVGPTSNDILEDIRRRTGIKKVGHAGTLDPLASGVLIVAIGRDATKRLSAEVAKEKEYLATIRLGEESTTDDAEGEKTKQAIETPPSREQIQEILPQFVGQIEQTPPKYSAIKIKGREAYKYARQNQTVVLEPRMVTVKEITLVSYAWPDVVLRIVTGPGVVIRSLARALGGALGVGGYISALERTRVGEFTKDQCVDPDQITVR